MDRAWLGRYSGRQLVRRRGSLETWSAIEQETGQRRLVLLAPSSALDAIATAHERIVGDGIAPLDHRGAHGGIEYVALVSDAQFDLEHLVRVLSVEQVKFPHAEGLVIADALLSALHAAHHTKDPQTGRPYVMGAMCFANVLMGPTGTVELLGLGANVLADQTTAAPLLSPGLSQAPETLVGAQISPASDVCAFYGLWRTLAAFADLPSSLTDAIMGRLGLAEELTTLMVQLDRAAQHPNPTFRIPDIAGLSTVMGRIRELHGREPNPAGFQRLMGEFGQRILAGMASERRPAPSSEAKLLFRLSMDAKRGILPSGEPLDLSRRKAPRLVLQCLARRYREAVGSTVSWFELQEAGWPGERMHPDSGRTRVYVAIYTLRKMGLADVITRHDDGYVIVPGVTLEAME